MPHDLRGRWYPQMSPKQLDVYNDRRRYMLLSGPRYCGKSIIALHMLVKHAWTYPNNRCGVFVKSMKLGKAGVWSDLISTIIPMWAEALEDEGFEVIKNAVDGSTRMHYVQIRNRHGGISEISLMTLNYEGDVKEKLKGTSWGFMLWDELDNYDDEDVFRVSAGQLRLIGLPYECHQYIASCNPAGDEDHWIHQVWYEHKNSEERAKTEEGRQYQSNLALHEFTLADNPFLDKNVIADLKNWYRDDPEMYQRYVEGKWTPILGDVLMHGAFKPALHIKGNLSTGEVILPSDQCQELILGWDLGDRNHAVSLLEKVETLQGPVWFTLDEIVHIGSDIPIEVIVEEVLEMMDRWNTLVGKKLHYIHYSDHSAIDRYRAGVNCTDAVQIMQLSKGTIELIGVPKGPGSVAQRINLTRQLFIANRLYLSTGTPKIIETMKRACRGKTKAEPIKRCKRGFVHVLDSTSYALYGNEMQRIVNTPLRPRIGAMKPFSVAA